MAPSQSTPPPIAAKGTRGLSRLKTTNLSELLRLIHLNGSISRSLLAQEAHLTRSSVQALIAELEQRGLVRQAVGEADGDVGRPSTIVLSSDNVVSLAVLLAYDSTRVATVGLSGRVLRTTTTNYAQSPSPEQFVHLVQQMVEDHCVNLPRGTRVAGVGAAIPGYVRSSDGTVRNAFSLGWDSVPLADMLNQATGLPAWIENDGNAGCIAELHFGAGKNLSNMVFLLGGGGGIGGGIFINGQMLRGRDGFAGEFAHVSIADENHEVTSIVEGSLDSFVNRKTLLRCLGLDFADDPTLRRVLDQQQHLPQLSTELDRQALYLGKGLAMIVNIFNPESIVLTGFLQMLLELRGPVVDDSLRRFSLPNLLSGCNVVRGQLGDDVLLIGAGEMVFTHLIADPLGYPLFEVHGTELSRV